ncbi:MAG: YaeQ family protein [Nannocystaceae bacterium]
MALTATMFHLQVELADIDRGVYTPIDLRLAKHPSESMRYLLTRTLAYCLRYTEGIAFSKGGIASTDEPPIAVHDPTGLLLEWIDVGAPSAERLHRATRAARHVSLYTHTPLTQLRREAASRTIYRVASIAVWRIEASFLDAIEPKIDRNTRIEVMHNDGHLYVTIAGETIDGALSRCSLLESASE